MDDKYPLTKLKYSWVVTCNDQVISCCAEIGCDSLLAWRTFYTPESGMDFKKMFTLDTQNSSSPSESPNWHKKTVRQLNTQKPNQNATNYTTNFSGLPSFLPSWPPSPRPTTPTRVPHPGWMDGWMVGWMVCQQVTVFMDDRMDNVWTGNCFHGW
jgi:hypothetical protein